MLTRKTGRRAVASRDASRQRPLLPLPAVNHLLNPVVDGDRRLPLRLVVVVAQAGTSVGGD
jgi:hypothetical protein